MLSAIIAALLVSSSESNKIFHRRQFDTEDELQATPVHRGRIEPSLRPNLPQPVPPYPFQEQIDPFFLKEPAAGQAWVEDPAYIPVYLQKPSDTNYKYWIIHHNLTNWINELEIRGRQHLEHSEEGFGIAEFEAKLAKFVEQRANQKFDWWLPLEAFPLDPDYFNPGGSSEDDE